MTSRAASLGIGIVAGAVCVAACATVARDARAADSPVAADAPILGRTLTEFSLKDFRGATHALPDPKDKPLVVVAFLGTECPLARSYAGRLQELATRYAERGVAVLGVMSNRQDAVTEIATFAEKLKIEYPLLKDLGNTLADRLGAKRTPEVFVLDRERTVRYHGRIDDQYGIGTVRPEPQRRDLAVALDELLAGKPVSVPETPATGCLIGRIRTPKAESTVTYSNQIARILQARCVECHRPGEIAPFALTSYEEVVGWAETIDEVVRDNRMPPWHAAPGHARFRNERRLTDEERAQIAQWVRDGAPEGDRAALPQPVAYVEGWNLPRLPDVVIPMRETPFDVPAKGEVRYQFFSVDPRFAEDRWVRAAEILPGNRSVVHHVLVLVQTPAGGRDGGPGEFLAAFVPGLRPEPYPDGMAKRIPAGSRLIFQIHYTPTGTPQKDLSRLGLIFAPQSELTHAVVTSRAATNRFSIPPRTADHRIEATSSASPGNLLLLSMSPHMHLRGSSFRYESLKADGKSSVLLDIPRYDFNWQTTYRLANPLPIAAGDRMRCIATYDNSEGNPNNPDPSQTVRWGDQTWEEMMIGYFDVAVPIAALEQRPAPGPGGPAVADLDPDRVLARLDADKNGKLERSEVPERLRPIFDRVDADKDGTVTRTELERAAAKLKELQQPRPTTPSP